MVFEWQDVDFLYHFVRVYKPASILELGSGHSTSAMAKAIQDNQYGKLTSLDIKQYQQQTIQQIPNYCESVMDSVVVLDCEIHLDNGGWRYEYDFLPFYSLIYIDGPAYTSDDQYTYVPAEYRYLIIDGRKKTIEQIQDKPLSVFIK